MVYNPLLHFTKALESEGPRRESSRNSGLCEQLLWLGSNSEGRVSWHFPLESRLYVTLKLHFAHTVYLCASCRFVNRLVFVMETQCYL